MLEKPAAITPKEGLNLFPPLDSEIVAKYSERDQAKLRGIYEDLMARSLKRQMHLYAARYGEGGGPANTQQALPKSAAGQEIYSVAPEAVNAEEALMHMEDRRREIQEQAETTLRLKREIDYDPLTGLLRRDAFALYYEQEINRLMHVKEAERAATNPSLLVSVDLDHFKTINDRHGHGVGDLVLHRIGEALSGKSSGHGIRPTDEVGRWGGDELVILLKDIPPQNTEQAVARVYKLLHSLTLVKVRIDSPLIHGGPTVPCEGGKCYVIVSQTELDGKTAGAGVTHDYEEIKPLRASLGVKVLKPGEQATLEGSLRQTDDAAFTTKLAGRDGATFIDKVTELTDGDYHLEGRTLRGLTADGTWRTEGELSEIKKESTHPPETEEETMKKVISALEAGRVFQDCAYSTTETKILHDEILQPLREFVKVLTAKCSTK